MLWQNENTIVVGKNQNTAEEINSDVVKSRDIKVVRRLSGGGAVYHDIGNLNFTYIMENSKFINFHFEYFARPVIDTLASMGIDAKFTGRNDITIDGKKFSGNSQYRRDGKILHHGCIMVNSNINDVSDALRVNAQKYRSAAVKSVTSRITTIANHTATPITAKQFGEKLILHFGENAELVPITLSDDMLREIHEIEKKYKSYDWNFGQSPTYNVRKEQKFDFGIITALLTVKKGVIESVKFYGDFFGSGEISEFENALISQRLDISLKSTLNKLDIDYYFSKITADDIYRLLAE